MNTKNLAPLALLVTAGMLTAQSPDDPTAQPAPRPTTTASPAPLQEVVTPTPPTLPAIDRFTTPIHTAADDPEGGPYGIWGAGADYKVSFHGAFTFVPYLGRDYPHNQPWSWTTVAVTRNGAPAAELAPQPARRQAPYRYEYDHGGVVEAYDVLLDGVEQTFVFKHRPSGSGDLEIVGRVVSALTAGKVPSAVTGLSFADAEGRRILRYGKALAFDAAGRRCDVRTSHDAGEIRLTLDGAWLDAAALPVTIDPLLTRESIAFWNTSPVTTDGAVTATAVGRDDVNNQPAIAYTRNASATDSDLWCFLFDTDNALRSERHQIFTDITTSWGDESPNLATVGGTPASWILAFVRPFPGASRGPRLHAHVLADTTLQTTFVAVSRPAGTKVQTMDVGGRNAFDASNVCCLVYDRNLDTNADNLAVFGITYSPSAGFGTEAALSQSSLPQTDYTNAFPKLNQVADQTGADGWMVVWQSYWDTRGAPDDYDVVGRRVDETCVPAAGLWVGLRSTPDVAHKLGADVAGQSGRYLVTYAEWTESPLSKTTSLLGGQIFADRLEWPLGGSQIRPGYCEITTGFVQDRRWSNDSVAFDDNSRSHWAAMLSSTISGTQYVEMLGYDAGMTERATVYAPGGSLKAFGGAITYNNDTSYPAGEFLMSYATNEGSTAGGVETHPVYSHRYQHFPEVGPTAYGTGCGGSIGYSGRVLRGSDSFAVTMTGGPANSLAALFMSGFTTPPTPAPFLLPNCFVNIGAVLGNVTLFTNAAGNASVRLPFPACGLLITGPYTFQWLWLSGSGIGSTQGLSILIN
jgi:hypothetical protein